MQRCHVWSYWLIQIFKPLPAQVPASVDFGHVPAKEAAEQSFIIRNVGDAQVGMGTCLHMQYCRQSQKSREYLCKDSMLSGANNA